MQTKQGWHGQQDGTPYGDDGVRHGILSPPRHKASARRDSPLASNRGVHSSGVCVCVCHASVLYAYSVLCLEGGSSKTRYTTCTVLLYTPLLPDIV